MDDRVLYTQGATIPPFGVYTAAQPFTPGAMPLPNGIGQPAERAQPPSTYAVQAALEGQNGAMLRLLGLTALRAIFIAPGLWVGAKVSGAQVHGAQLVIISLASSSTISAGMLAWYALNGLLKKRTA